jgi:signal transduction histidine kinase
MGRRFRRHRRSRRDVLSTALVVAGLALYVLLVYVVVVLGGGVLVGRTTTPDLTLSVLATAVVALSLDPVRHQVERVVAGLLHPGQRSPYEVLSTFSSMVGATSLAGDVPQRMAQVLAQGTGAQRAEVWLVVDGTPTLSAAWPDSGDRGIEQVPDPAGPVAGHAGELVRRCYQAGELLGLLVVHERPGVPFTPTEERLLSGLADQAGLVLRGQRLRAELERRREELSARADELGASRRRLVEAQDRARRRLERDIHDGAQQHLVALAVNLRLAHTVAQHSPERGATLLAGQEAAVREATETLLGLAGGIYPQRLVAGGLAEALQEAAGTIPVRVTVAGLDSVRYDADIEAAAYFCCMEALQNAAKHAGATHIDVSLQEHGGTLRCSVTDDGVGIDGGRGPGSGLANMRDRVEAIGGTLHVLGTPGVGTRVEARLPARRLASGAP